MWHYGGLQIASEPTDWSCYISRNCLGNKLSKLAVLRSIAKDIVHVVYRHTLYGHVYMFITLSKVVNYPILKYGSKEEVSENPSINQVVDSHCWNSCFKKQFPIYRPFLRQRALYVSVSYLCARVNDFKEVLVLHHQQPLMEIGEDFMSDLGKSRYLSICVWVSQMPKATSKKARVPSQHVTRYDGLSTSSKADLSCMSGIHLAFSDGRHEARNFNISKSGNFAVLYPKVL